MLLRITRSFFPSWHVRSRACHSPSTPTLMTNHFHLLIERQAHTIGEIMHRLLTGYSNYYNRRHRRVGHLFQDRHKSILCQSDRYLTELVRYIHLFPVRAGMVDAPEQYQYSGHRAYLGLALVGSLDID